MIVHAATVRLARMLILDYGLSIMRVLIDIHRSDRRRLAAFCVVDSTDQVHRLKRDSYTNKSCLIMKINVKLPVKIFYLFVHFFIRIAKGKNKKLILICEEIIF